MPRVILAPIFGMWFGLGIWSKVALAVTLVFFIVFFNVYQGVREVSPTLLDNARMLARAPPAAAPRVPAVRHQLGVLQPAHLRRPGLRGRGGGRVPGSASGVGYLILQAEGTFDVNTVFAGIVVLTAFALALDYIVGLGEKRLMKWQPSRAKPKRSERSQTMARIPYADLSHPEAQPLVERIVAERGSVLHLYQMLLHSPAVAGGWLNYLTSIRQLSTLPGDLRELVIMRVAVLNGAPYEADQHAPIALKEGVTQAQLDALDGWQDSALFDARERAVLAYTDAMTRQVQVPDAVFQAARQAMGSDKLLVELTATVAAYNMVSRFLEALQVHTHDHR